MTAGSTATTITDTTPPSALHPPAASPTWQGTTPSAVHLGDFATRRTTGALGGLAPGDALHDYTRALHLYQRSGNTDPILAVDLAIGLGTAQRQTAHPQFRDTLLDAARRAADLDDADRLAAATLANNRGMFSVAGTVDAERLEILELAIARLPDEHPTRALLLARLCAELTFGSSLERRQALADEALAVARSSGDDTIIVRVLNDVSFPLTVPELLAQGLARSEEALQRAERIRDPALLAWAAHLRAGLCLCAGDVEEMARCFGIAWELGERLNHPFLRWQRAVMRGLCALVAGDVDEAEAQVNEAIEIGTANGEPDVAVFAAGQLSAVKRQRGELDDLAETIEQLRIQLPGLHDTLTASLAGEHARCGRLDLAQTMLDELAAGDFELCRDPNWHSNMVNYAMTAVACDDKTIARSIYEILEPFADQFATTAIYPMAPVNHYLGELATVLGRYDQADAHFGRAAAFSERAKAAYLAALTDVSWARMQIARGAAGDAAAARTRAATARSLAAERGYRDIERDATDLLARPY